MSLQNIITTKRHVAKCCLPLSASFQRNCVTEVTPVEARPRIPHRASYEKEMIEQRQKWVEQFSGCKLKETKGFWDDESIDTSILKGNIEMPISMAKIPLAVAGPLLCKGTHANGFHLLPVATTEGTLVASITR